MNERNFSALRDLYDDRATTPFVPPAGAPQTGVAPYLQALADFRGQFQNFTWAARNIQTSSLGTAGAATIVAFHGEGALTTGGQAVAIDGSETSVWQRRPTGWKIVHEHWSAPWTPPSAPAPAPVVENAASAVGRLLKAYEDAWTTGDAGALADLWADEGDIGTLGATPTKGRAAVADFWKQSIARRRAATLVHAVVATTRGMSGEVIVADGAFEYRTKAAQASAAPASVDRFALTLARDGDGEDWKIATLRIAAR